MAFDASEATTTTTTTEVAATLTCATATTTTTGRVIPSNNNTTELDLTNRCGKNSRKRSHRVIGFVRCLHQLQQMRSAAAKSGDGLLKFSRNSESDLAFTNAIHVTTPETVLGYNGMLLVCVCLYSSVSHTFGERVKPCFSQVLVSVLTERKTVLARKIDHSRVMLWNTRKKRCVPGFNGFWVNGSDTGKKIFNILVARKPTDSHTKKSLLCPSSVNFQSRCLI